MLLEDLFKREVRVVFRELADNRSAPIDTARRRFCVVVLNDHGDVLMPPHQRQLCCSFSTAPVHAYPPVQ